MTTIVKKGLYNNRLDSNNIGCDLMSKNFMKTILLTIMLLISLFSFIVFLPPINGVPSNNNTTLYFKDVIGVSSDPEYDSNLGLTVLVSESFPVKTNDSVYPPNMFNGLSFNSEEWITWFSTTWLFYFLDDLTGEYEEFDEFGDLFEGLELLFPNPLRIVESYEYTGTEIIQINGNVNFNLFLSSKLFSKISANDEVRIGLYSLNSDSIFPIPIKIDDKTIEVDPELFQSIKNKEIVLENINHSLKPGESLLFEIELIPGNKTIIDILIEERPVLENLTEKAIEILYNLANNSDNPNLNDIIEIINMVNEVSDEINITKEDAAIVINSLISTSFVYDSINHPSSVSLPLNTPGGYNGDNELTYFLHSEDIMDEETPISDEHAIHDLSNPIEWEGPGLERSKILNNANVLLYLNYKDINYLSNNIQINAGLFYKNQEIVTSTYTLDKTQLQSPTSNIIINLIFEDFQDNIEIEYSNPITLKISIDNSSDFGIGILKKADLFYDSNEYSSKLILHFSETNNINVNTSSDPIDGKIIPGETVTYSLDVYSKYFDEIEIIELSSTGAKEYWNIEIPNTFNISGGFNKTVEIIISSTEIDLSSYGEEINIKYSIQGKTGKSIIYTNASISESAVEYDFKITAPPNKNIKHGNTDSYFFLIKNNNTGLWPDSYTIEAISENGWNITINPSNNIDNIDAGETAEINVTIFIPKNIEIKTDNLTFIVNSINGEISKSVNVTSNIIGPDLIENLFNYFESLAEKLGLNDIFDEYAPHALVALIFIIIFIILIIIVFLITSKFVNIICLNRIKEISPNETALFEISVENPSKKFRNYKISVTEKDDNTKWKYKFDNHEINLNAKESRKISLNVKPNDLIQSNDWGEFDFKVQTKGKRKIEKITTMVMIKNSKIDVSLKNINHLPRIFKEGDKIITSFILKNNGNVSTDYIDIILYLNGEEKNKVGEIIIPAEGFAEIKIPWIGVKGKNDITILVKKY
jgi:hypothetical protein